MEIVVRGRNVEVPDHFRAHVAEKLGRVERFDAKIIRTDVELLHEKNPRQSDVCQRVEITCRVPGPVVRAEACAHDFYAALDIAVGKLERRFRHAADRRRVHHGRHNPTSLAMATGTSVGTAVLEAPASENDAADDTAADGPGRIVREKTHSTEPISVDQALHEMELVGHDFFLFHDSATDLPSVVYRRKAYDYGVIRLGAEQE